MEVKPKKDSTGGVEELLRKEPLLLLKIGLMQAFTTMMLLAWFGDVYYGGDTWTSTGEALVSNAAHIIASLPATLRVSFQWPSFSVTFEVSFYLFACSVGMLAVEYILKFVGWLDRWVGDHIPIPHLQARWELRGTVIKCLHIIGDIPMVMFRLLTHWIVTGCKCVSQKDSGKHSSNAANLNDQLAHGTSDSRWRMQTDAELRPVKNQTAHASVTNEEVAVYAANNPEQEIFDLSGCVKLTDQAIWAVLLSRRVNKDHKHLKMLSITNCTAITDDGIAPFANTSPGTTIDEVLTYGVEALTIVTVTKLLLDCAVAPKHLGLQESLREIVDHALGGSEPSTAEGKTSLFLAAEPEASKFAIPIQDKMEDDEVTSLLLSMLKNLANLTIGGLRLDQAHKIKAINLGGDHNWLTEKHYCILFSVPELALSVTSLNLSNEPNLKEGVSALKEIVAQRWTLIRKLDVSGCKLGADDAAVLADAVRSMVALTSLDLSSNNLEGEGAKTVAEAIKVTNCMIVVVVWHHVHAHLTTGRSAVVIYCYPQDNRAMTNLSLASTSLGVEGAQVIAAVLPKCT
jgi:hypothetical protein